MSIATVYDHDFTMQSPFANYDMGDMCLVPFFSDEQLKRVRYAKNMLKVNTNMTSVRSQELQSLNPVTNHRLIKRTHRYMENAGIIMVTHKKPFTVRFASN